MNYSTEDWILRIVISGCVALACFACYLGYSLYTSPAIEITKADWDCTKTETRTYLQPMLIGKTTTLMPMTRAICTEYRRHD